MSSSYQLNASNSTAQGWHVALYQKQPEEPGLKTIAWKVLSLSKPQPEATKGIIPWDLTFKVTVPQSDDGNVYTGGISVAAKLGRRYSLVLQDGYQQIVESGAGTPGYIDFKNETKNIQNLGLLVDGDLMSMQTNVTGGVTAQFQVTPTYYCALYTNIKKGIFVSSDAAVEAIQVRFPDGLTIATVEAMIKDDKVRLSGPEYSH